MIVMLSFRTDSFCNRLSVSESQARRASERDHLPAMLLANPITEDRITAPLATVH